MIPCDVCRASRDECVVLSAAIRAHRWWCPARLSLGALWLSLWLRQLPHRVGSKVFLPVSPPMSYTWEDMRRRVIFADRQGHEWKPAPAIFQSPERFCLTLSVLAERVR